MKNLETEERKAELEAIDDQIEAEIHRIDARQDEREAVDSVLKWNK